MRANDRDSTPNTATRETARRTERITQEPAASLAGLLDLDRDALDFTDGAAIPPLWHWLYLLDRPAQRDLGPDGHPSTGIPAPPGPGRRRMFAGGRITTLRPLRVGAEATRTTQVAETTEKQGRTGHLTFVTVRHEIEQAGELAIVEEQDIVYRDQASNSLPGSKAADTSAPAAQQPQLRLHVDESLLFRFSALTYNAHRIHYDRQWARHEGYADVVVHGPLQALLMAELLRRNGVDLIGRQFEFRLVAPMIGPQTLSVIPSNEGLSAGAEVHDLQQTITARSQVDPTD